MGCGKKGHFKKMCKSGSKSNQLYRENRSFIKVKEEISEESSASDDHGYPTRLGKREVREAVARSLQVAGVLGRRDKVLDKTSI